MAPITTLQTTVPAESQRSLDSSQTLRASTALLRKIRSDQTTQKAASGKANLLADADDNESAEDAVPIWLILTTKKHIIDKKRLKPGKIVLPHPYLNNEDANLRICLITADPQRKYKDLVAHPAFPLDLGKRIHRVIDITKLKAKYGKSFESRRQLLSEYDVFVADDRIITSLPQVLGKVFYKGGSKRPIPVSFQGKKQDQDEQGNKRRKLAEGGTKALRNEVEPQAMAREIQKTISSALVHLAPSTTTAVKVGIASMSAEDVQANVEAVVEAMVDKYVPQKWSNLQAVHIKGPNTVALPIWLADELWQDEADVLEQAPGPLIKEGKKRKRQAGSDVIEVPGPDGQMRRLERPVAGTKRKSTDAEPEPELSVSKAKKDELAEDLEARIAEKKEKAERKSALKKQKEDMRSDANGSTAKSSKRAKKV